MPSFSLELEGVSMESTEGFGLAHCCMLGGPSIGQRKGLWAGKRNYRLGDLLEVNCNN